MRHRDSGRYIDHGQHNGPVHHHFWPQSKRRDRGHQPDGFNAKNLHRDQYGGCATNSATAPLTFNALPAQPTLTANRVLLTAAAAPSATYQLYLNGVAIADATNATYTATQNSSYTVVVTNATGYASLSSAPVSMAVTADRADLSTTELTMYPDSTTGRYPGDTERQSLPSPANDAYYSSRTDYCKTKRIFYFATLTDMRELVKAKKC